MRATAWQLVFLGSLSLAARVSGYWRDDAVPVEPADLALRTDLIGREVIVDDRVTYYVPRSGEDPDELTLKRTPVTFLVQKGRRLSGSRRMTAVVARGVLKRAGDRLVCEVLDLQIVPGDLARLEQGIAGLGATDLKSRKAWASWAERRARDFKDEALLRRTRELQAEVLRLESQLDRLGVDAPREWLAKARDARRRQLPEPEPGALAHRALRAQLAAASSLDELQTVIQAIEEFFPGVASDPESGRMNLAAWEAEYKSNPAATYRRASAPVRRALNRRLWTDATARLLELQTGGDLISALAAAERARTILPERPDYPSHLINGTLEHWRPRLGSLRLDEVKALAAAYREKVGDRAAGLLVLQDWLTMQQDRLSKTDADGRLALAALYEELLEDRVTAVELLRKAWRIDPGSKEIAEAFRTRGFRKVKDDWVEGAPTVQGSAAQGAPERDRPETASSRGLRGMTPDEVRATFGGPPNHVSYVGSKGQLVEQWIFLVDTKRVHYVNLLRAPGELKPRVIADYALPRKNLKGEIGSAR
jgi:tetratricopeptide (TPR) repeat protein